MQGGTAPGCALVRASSAVFRLYANASLAGAGLTVTSCGYTTAGDPVVSVVSSPNPAGPYTCVGSNDNSCSYGFSLSVPLTAGLYYFFSVGAFSSATSPTLRLSLSLPSPPPPPAPPPPALPGSWANPIDVTALPLLSSQLSFVAAGTSPANCALSRTTAVVFRLYAAQAGTLTASGCGLTTGDPVVSILSSTARTGGTFACEGSNDDSLCGSAFTLTVSLRAGAFYFVSVGPYSLTALPTMRLNLTGSGIGS